MEVWDLVDESRNPIGKLHRKGEQFLPGEYHVSVEVHTITADGRLLVIQRDASKSYPSLWESAGGSVYAGETSMQGAVRELAEETGLLADQESLHFLGEIKREHSILDSYLWISSKLINPDQLELQPGEVSASKLVTMKELEAMNNDSQIVPPVWERYQLYYAKLASLILP